MSVVRHLPCLAVPGVAALAGALVAAPVFALECVADRAPVIGARLCAALAGHLSEDHGAVALEVLEAGAAQLRVQMQTAGGPARIHSLRVQDAPLSEQMIDDFAAYLAATVNKAP